MKNTPENKAKFFAQYWGQRVWRYNHTNGESNLLYIDAPTLYNKKSFGFRGYLELKSLSQITDEDALAAYRFHYPFEKWDDIEERDLVDTQEAVDWLKYHYNEKGYIRLTAEGSDYLRLKGYAIDWNGISVEQQIEWGWVKLTANSQPPTDN